MSEIGKVFLVGAGPGDPELLTVKARRLIEHAKVVVFDRLVSDEILSLAPKNAEFINVGKNAGNHLVPQHEINQILVDKALEGNDVVRLQGGDCFMFGRGGEELELLAENNINFEMIPGITSAFAAPIYAGIPITHRKFCSSVHIVTGHKKQDGELTFDFDALVKMGGTMIFLMAVSTVSKVANGLLSAGIRPDMPCAVIENGTRPYQRSFVSDISNIEKTILKNNVISPAAIIVGEVCGFSKSFNWFEKLPLFGKKIMVTRPQKNANILSQKLKNLGADVLNLPAIETKKLDFDIDNISEYSAIFFTSMSGIEAFFAEFTSKKRNFNAILNKKIAVSGAKTRDLLEKYGYFDAFLPSIYSGEALANECIASNFINKNDKILLVRAEKASEKLPEILSENGFNFDELKAYETLPIENKIDEATLECLDYVTFTSASCVESFSQAVPKNTDFSKLSAMCIGEQTAEIAQNLGMKTIISKEATIESMVEKLLEL